MLKKNTIVKSWKTKNKHFHQNISIVSYIKYSKVLWLILHFIKTPCYACQNMKRNKVVYFSKKKNNNKLNVSVNKKLYAECRINMHFNLGHQIRRVYGCRIYQKGLDLWKQQPKNISCFGASFRAVNYRTKTLRNHRRKLEDKFLYNSKSQLFSVLLMCLIFWFCHLIRNFQFRILRWSSVSFLLFIFLKLQKAE